MGRRYGRIFSSLWVGRGFAFFAESERLISLTIEVCVGMLSLLLCLKFGCTGCGDPIDATLQCEGKGLADNAGGTIVKISCPCCGTKNDVVATPDGTVHGVARTRTYGRIPEPSVN